MACQMCVVLKHSYITYAELFIHLQQQKQVDVYNLSFDFMYKLNMYWSLLSNTLQLHIPNCSNHYCIT